VTRNQTAGPPLRLSFKMLANDGPAHPAASGRLRSRKLHL